MKFKDMQSLSKEELTKQKAEIEFELMKARAQSVRGTVAKNPHSIQGMRINLTRIEQLLSRNIAAKNQAAINANKGSKKSTGQKIGGKAKA